MINESEYAHQALSDIVPLRDLFGMLFFVSVGMLLDPALVWQQIGARVFVVMAIVLGKLATHCARNVQLCTPERRSSGVH